MTKPAKRPAKRPRSGSPSFPENPPVPARIPQRDSQHSSEAFEVQVKALLAEQAANARRLVLSGALERRVGQLERTLPPERPARRGRRIPIDVLAKAAPEEDRPALRKALAVIPVWELDPAELRERPLAPLLGGVDMTAVIRRRLADSTRHAKARRYLAATEALADAAQLVTHHAPALRERRRLAELEQHRAQDEQHRARIAGWSRRGAAERRRAAKEGIEAVLVKARQIRGERQFADASLVTLAKEIRRKTPTIALSVRYIRQLLSQAGMGRTKKT